MPKEKMIHKHNTSFFRSWHLFVLILPSVVFTTIFIAFANGSSVKQSSATAVHATPIPKLNIAIGDTLIKANKADTARLRNIGLSETQFLPEDEGMLFIFEGNDVHPVTFWMKGMSIPIDIFWIDDNRIVQIDENVQPEIGVPDSELKLYPSNQPIDYVIEVNAGFAEEHGIEIGTQVDF